MDIPDYELGIIWSIGSYNSNRFVFRHKEKYFLERLQHLFGGTIYKQAGQSGKPQFVLKVSSLSPDDLPGWTNRNAEVRAVPDLLQYNDFMRAYFEIHSCLDYCIAYHRKSKMDKYKKLRLRLYGNYELITDLGSILSSRCVVEPKALQYVQNGKTAYIAYTCLSEIQQIGDWLTGTPYFAKFWQDWDAKMNVPIKNAF